jgi:ATP-dependent DNA helicase UvrD/PcrA
MSVFNTRNRKGNFKVSHKPTEEQQVVLDTARDTDASLMIKAGAGCAKSTTLKMLGPIIKEPTLGMAFNKSTAQAMINAMPSNFLWKTANGLGHGAWIRANASVNKWTLDERKLGKLVSATAKERRSDLTSEQWDSARQLVSAAMLSGLTPDGIGRPLVEDTQETWDALADEIWIPRDEKDFMTEFARVVLIENINLARRGTISFDDQVYCSVCLGGKFTQFANVMVDEAQDLNSLNHQMIAASLRSDGRIFAVGDERQAIYAFRGAHTESMEQIRVLRKNWRDLPLMLTFRCPKVVVARQQEHAPGFRAHESNAEGAFRQLPERGMTYSEPGEEPIWGWSDLCDLMPRAGGELAILCRNNAPLMSMAFKLIRRRVGVKMLGRQLGKNLISFSKKVVPEDLTSAINTAAMLTAWLDKERSLLVANDKEHEVEGIEDRVECLRAVLEDAEARDAGSMRRIVGDLFAKESGLVTLGSGHRSKGLEWDIVLHIDPWRLPSKQAKKAEAAGDSGPMKQEKNLKYVVETRTKHTLAEANLEDFT